MCPAAPSSLLKPVITQEEPICIPLYQRLCSRPMEAVPTVRSCGEMRKRSSDRYGCHRSWIRDGGIWLVFLGKVCSVQLAEALNIGAGG